MDIKYSRLFFIGIVIILTALSFFIIRPFVSSILFSIILAYVFYPLYKWFLKRTNSKNLSAFTTILIILLIIAIPIAFIINAVSREAIGLYAQARDNLQAERSGTIQCELNDLLCRGFVYSAKILSNPESQSQLDAAVKRFSSALVGATSNFLLAIPNRVLGVFIMFFVLFCLLKEGKEFVVYIEEYLPVDKKHHRQIFKQFNDVTHAVIFGNVVVALTQGAVATLGFVMFGISSPFVWGVLMTLFAFVPYIGPAVIWFPAAVILILDGYTQMNNILLFKGIGLILYGLIIVSWIDNITKPWIIGDRANIHPIAVLLGVLGGLQVFGFAGIVIGPLVIAMLITFLQIYKTEEVEYDR